MAATKAVKKPHWYRIEDSECPGCGRCRTIRERVYGEPPKDSAERYVYSQTGCAGAGCHSWL